MANSNNPARDSRTVQKGTKPTAAASGSAPPMRTPPPPPIKIPPLFRRIDWITLLLTFAVVWVVYFLTVAPELTLEDSGELVTGSMYAGIPHPPGYPVWTIYSWLWTVLVPVGNPAWRVALAEAFAGALACGFLSLLVSRGSSMFMESIEELKNMTGKWENAICMVSGFVAGLLLGLDGFMWRESVAVNRIAVSSVPWFLLVMLCLLRWLYAPHQMRFVFWALFVFGICFTTHQSLIVAGLGIQIAIAAGNRRLGRDVFFMNFVMFSLYWTFYFVTGQHLFPNIGAKSGLLNIFIVIGIGSVIAFCWLAVLTKTRGIEIARNLALGGVFLFPLLGALYSNDKGYLFFFICLTVGSLWLLISLARKTWNIGREWLYVLILGLLWVAGFSFYFYMPLAGMTNPPMQWGYPRTVEGFWHALSRGQYEQPNPTDVLADPTRFVSQLGMLVSGIAEEFTWVIMLIALVPFVFFFRMQRRERAWLIGLTAIYLCLGVLLIVLLNPTPDRATADLIKVFFNNSHTIIVALIGYGLALIAAFMATHYRSFRIWGIIGGGIAFILGVFTLWITTGKHFFGPAGEIGLSEIPHWVGMAFAKHQFGLPVFGNLVLVIVPLGFVLALVLYRNRAPLLFTLALYGALPLYSGMAHWYASNQHNHWFGYWFGHDMFTPPFKGADGKPIYPEMTKDAVLYGGTDPGRFCPTYMIFCESFTPHNCQPAQDQKFDRRDVYIITQNALADGTYLNYIRAHYNRSKQIDPPFFQEFLRSAKERAPEANYTTNLAARMISPLDDVFESLGARIEKRRRTYTSWFKDKDFLDLAAFAARLRPSPGQDAVSKYIYDNLSSGTRQLLAAQGNVSSALRQSLMKDLNLLLDKELRNNIGAKQREKDAVDKELATGSTSAELRQRQQQLAKEISEITLYSPARFSQVPISEYLTDFIKENPLSYTRVRLNRLLLEAAYPKLIATSLGGVYPDREIYIATPEDSQRCFNEYLQDANRRLQHDMNFPNEPKQIRPGEDVRIVENRVTVAGQVAVMAINGLLTKVMFDHNPKNEFFVEESFPLDWMYPHLTPYGIIMKINRQPLPTLTEDILQRDHDFWKQYSKRFTGDIIDYDTPLKDIADWIDKTYLRKNLNGFTGDRKFIHDDDAQKAFSKLRSSIGGIYAWRLSPQCPPQYKPKSDAEYNRILKEADFTFKQAFVFCPYSPEAVFRYVNLLLQLQRLDDALIVAKTCLKLDPYSAQVRGLVNSLEAWKSQRGAAVTPEPQPITLEAMEKTVREHPSNFQASVELAKIYLQLQQTGRAVQLLDSVVNNSNADAPAVVRAAMVYQEMMNLPKLEGSLERLVQVSPESPEAWYDLAGTKANARKDKEALDALHKALVLNAERLHKQPGAPNIVTNIPADPRFTLLRQSPEFQKQLSAK